jgi:DNA-binding CsgD family transcriptional regulator
VNWKSYYEARGYAWKLNPNNYLDIVHDAYIIWYNRTGNDLFEEHRGRVSQTVKFVFLNQHGAKRFMYRGQYYRKTYTESSWLYSDEDSPENVYLRQEEQDYQDSIIDRIAANLTPIRAEIFALLREGYNQRQISKKLGVNPQNIQYHVTQIIQHNSMWINPFSGSKVKVTKTVTLGQWEKRSDKDDYMEEDVK